MHEIKWKSILLTVGAVAAICVVAVVLTAQGKKAPEKFVLGDWYGMTGEEPAFTVYENGTVQFADDQELGTWSLVNEKRLILTNASGATATMEIVNIDEDNMEVQRIVDGQAEEKTITYWHTAGSPDTLRARILN